MLKKEHCHLNGNTGNILIRLGPELINLIIISVKHDNLIDSKQHWQLKKWENHAEKRDRISK